MTHLSLESIVDRLDGWPFGPIREIDRATVGAAFGFASVIERVRFEMSDGARATVIIKSGDAGMVEREFGVYRSLAIDLRDAIPRCLGYTAVDSGSGLLVLEDLSDLGQGDVLADVAMEHVTGLLAVLARLHRNHWADERIPMWSVANWDEARWIDRVQRASKRHPQVRELAGTLAGLLPTIHAGGAGLQDADVRRIHGDAHFDNVRFRNDGVVVLLDWAGAASGPPAIDVAAVMAHVSYSPEWCAAVLDSYVAERGHLGDPVDREVLAAEVADALLLMIRGTVGWAGLEQWAIDHPRFAEVRNAAVPRVLSWLPYATGVSGLSG